MTILGLSFKSMNVMAIRKAIPVIVSGTSYPQALLRNHKVQSLSMTIPLFKIRRVFLLAESLYWKVEMSSRNVNYLIEIWKSMLRKHGELSPFLDIKDLHCSIDAITQDTCITHFLLDNPELADHFDITPYIFFDASDERRYINFFSEKYAWRHSAFQQERADSAMNVTIILGSDKTTVSVATGNVEYHPVYLFIGNISNAARPNRRYDASPHFCTFKRRLYHTQYSAVLQPVKPGMIKPMVKHCPDHHYRQIIYDLGPDILDYPEQVCATCIVQNWCPRCDAPLENLDGDTNAIRRTHLWTDELIAGLDPDVL
ncbi:hypothetical protein K488DRAFT_74807 [Vararia minispora EC-137]|uniref:Uncharacterized protein n=1 Tax=Vararia minispora EC-137 TaxID=1314806 RepID=A0ACB8Q5Y0_9AGAM|nr:hypothetical protein K488DRAFT_74807 [Vararia minispora EC-137]